jgi:hypothetical protein
VEGWHRHLRRAESTGKCEMLGFELIQSKEPFVEF